MVDMDLLEQLENRIEDILSRLKTAEEKNGVLEEQVKQLQEEAQTGKADLESENVRLREELEQEKAAKEAVLNKIDGLLTKIAEQTTSS